MSWKVTFLEDAIRDIEELDKSQKIQVIKSINKVSANPLPSIKGGYGKPLGNKSGNNLSNLYKIKLKKSGIRIVYKLEEIENEMCIVVVAARKDNEVYKEAAKRNKIQR